MEVIGGKAKWYHVILYEFIGTAFLITAVNMTSDIDSGALEPIGVGLMLMCNILIFGRVSGGHFNPAVTTGVLLYEGLKGNILFYLAIVAS